MESVKFTNEHFSSNLTSSGLAVIAKMCDGTNLTLHITNRNAFASHRFTEVRYKNRFPYTLGDGVKLTSSGAS